MSTIPQRVVELKPKADAAAAPVVLKKNSLIGDYLQLFKVRVTTLIVVTAWTGVYMGAAKSGVSSLTWTLLNALVGIGVTCAGSAALNEVLEYKIDALMRRTRNRPLPAGRMSLATGMTAGILATVLGPVYLAFTTNVLTGVLAFSTALVYLALYTPLKRISPISTFVGAFPGAMPPIGGSFTDEQIAGVVTYIRNTWGLHAGAVDPATVAKVRAQVGGRIAAWSDSLLERVEYDLDRMKSGHRP